VGFLQDLQPQGDGQAACADPDRQRWGCGYHALLKAAKVQLWCIEDVELGVFAGAQMTELDVATGMLKACDCVCLAFASFSCSCSMVMVSLVAASGLH